MQTRIQGIIKDKRGFRKVDLFGYCTKGIPGLEIMGLGKYGRSVKEKFIFLSKSRGLKIPLKRYLLCAMDKYQLKDNSIDELAQMELPLLVLFWTLSDILPFYNLENCYTSGNVDLSGRVRHSSIPEIELHNLTTGLGNARYIFHSGANSPSGISTGK